MMGERGETPIPSTSYHKMHLSVAATTDEQIKKNPPSSKNG